jgi:tryptophan halogenase
MSPMKVKMIHGFHFDARRCAKYFREIGVERGIKHLDVNITNFTQKENGDISQIHTEEGIDVPVDFVFDCSGFARLCIGKLYKSEWKSYSKYLKANSAFAYFLPQNPDVNSTSETFTQSIAMKNGWMWQAPLQERWGCGYVYNDTYTTREEAKKEAEEYLGREIEIVKDFKFEAGSYQRTWINNCIALGLASGFLEPLEGTSLMGVITSINKLARIDIEDDGSRDLYNEFVNDMNHQAMLFVRHHYNCGRKDTKYWQDIQNGELPEDLQKILKNLYKFKETADLLEDINLSNRFPVFGLYNYVLVDLGHRTKQEKTLM